MSALGDVIDLDRYPIDRPESTEAASLIAACRRQLAADGVCSLPGFLRSDAIATTIDTGDRLRPGAWHADQTHNVYFTDLGDPDLETLHEDHPRRRRIRSSQWAVAYDLLPGDLPLRILYESDELLRFLERVLDQPVLYRSVDPLDACEISFFHPGDELGWHFDNSEFSVTVMLREPDAGGDFEYFPSIRSPDDERYDDVRAAIDGSATSVTLSTGPGTLAIFQGRHALHRVSPVLGDTSRMNAVLTFGAEPDMCLSPLTQELFYGRRVVPASAS